MYSIYSYGQMLSHNPRIEAYLAALRQSVKPDSVVLDLGCGPGVFALVACQLGAKRVYAVEPDSVIQLARELAASNGFARKIEFFQDFSTQIELPEPADIIVSDLRGVLPWYQQHIPSIIDARERLLAQNGILIPQRDVLWAALVNSPEKYDELVAPWNFDNLDLSRAKRLNTNTWRKADIKPEQLVGQPACWARLDYNEVKSPDVKSELSWLVETADTAHGFAVWFDSELIGNVGFSNRPGQPQLIYGTGFFPFSQPLEFAKRDRVDLILRADLIDDDYVWCWHTTIRDAQDQVKAEFQQTTFNSVPLSPNQLLKRTNSYKPTLDEKGRVRSFIMRSMNGDNSLEEIAAQLKAHFPDRYADVKQAFNEVAAVSLEFGQ